MQDLQCIYEDFRQVTRQTAQNRVSLRLETKTRVIEIMPNNMLPQTKWLSESLHQRQTRLSVLARDWQIAYII